MRVNHGLTPQDLKAYGINDVRYRPQPQLRHVVSGRARPEPEGYERGVLTTLGAIAVDTGILPVVLRKISISCATTPPATPSGGPIKAKVKRQQAAFAGNRQHLKGLVTQQLSGKRLFIVDAFCGANADTRLSVRFITEVAGRRTSLKHVHSSER